MNVRLNSRVMLFVCLGLGWSGEGWGACKPSECDCYTDSDSDGFGDTNDTSPICEPKNALGNCSCPTGTASTKTDCDDSEAAINPDETESCDTLDNDCDSKTDEDTSGTATYCLDSDGDEYWYGACLENKCATDSTIDATYKRKSDLKDGNDCDDDDRATYPGAGETVPAAKDLNCSASCGYYIDEDGDGIGVNGDPCLVSVTEGAACLAVGADDSLKADEVYCVLYDAADGIAYSYYMGKSCDESQCAQPFDCNPNKSDVYPGKMLDTCEPGSAITDQVDEDCDGSLHTYRDSSGSSIPAVDARVYYADTDGDSYGDADKSATICAPDTIGGIPYTSSNNIDCDDSSGAIYPGAIEVCNASDGAGRGDEDCDGLRDEVRKVSGLSDEQIEAARCEKAYYDGDKDGDGDVADSKPPVCICESSLTLLGDPFIDDPSRGWDSIEECKSFYGEYDEYCITMNYCVFGADDVGCCTHPFERDSESCTSWVVDKELKELRDVYGVTASGVAFLSSSHQDCNDDDPLIKFSYSSPEVLDGRDSDCSGYVPAVEFDCDGDTYIAGEYQSVLTGDDGCERGDPKDILCLGYSVRMECTPQRISPTEEVLQWQIRLADVPSFVDKLATKRAPTVLDGIDCDDSCSSRSPGEEESCDGLDNNCTLTRPEDCTPIKALTGECAGTVCEDEADPDGDGAISCNAQSKMVCAREVQTSLQCDGTAEVFRGDPKAYCTRATPYKNSDDPNASGVGVDARCDGVEAAPNGQPYEGEEDEDRDGHYACGPQHNLSGGELGGSESVFVLMYFAGDEVYPGGVNAVPLLYPRAAPGGGVLPSDVTLARRLLEDLDKLDWPTSGEAADPLRPITHGQRVVGDPFSGAVDGLQDAAPYPKADPLLELCVRAEICATHTSGIAPEWCSTGRGDDGLSGRCAVVEMKLSEASGLVFDPPDATDSGDLVGADSPSDSGTADVFVGAPIAGELAGRLVWPQARIIESRRRVVEWDCFLTFGTYGCGALTQPADLTMRLARFRPSTLGAERVYSARLDAAMSDTRWWKELGRYYDGRDDPGVAVVVTETLLSCWGNPTVEEDLTVSVHGRVGGDCRDVDSSDDSNKWVHRDALEGPDDVLGLLTGQQVDCDTCEDGLDNNCDGLTDCEDPGCAPCWVGQGGASGGCSGADPEAPCGSSGGCSAGRGVRSPWPSLGELGLLLLAALGLPLLRRGVK